MVNAMDLLKVILLIQLVNFSLAAPLSDEASYESGYDQDIAGWIPVPASFFQQQLYQYPRFSAPTYNERAKTWLVAPSKRNSELINSLLGLPKNMDAAGK